MMNIIHFILKYKIQIKNANGVFISEYHTKLKLHK